LLFDARPNNGDVLVDIPAVNAVRDRGLLWLTLCLCSFPACAESDESTPDPPAPAPGLSATLCDLTDGVAPVAVSPDGERVAYVTCNGDPRLMIHEFESGLDVEVTDAHADSSVEWLLDSDADPHFLLFGRAGEWSVIPDDGSTEPTPIANGTLLDHRPISQKQGSTTTFLPRLLVLEENENTKRVLVRRPDDGYAEPAVLASNPDLRGDLSQLSGSGRTLVLETAAADADVKYVAQYTYEASGFAMPFGPKSWILAPVGLGDKHTYVMNDDEFARIELADGDISVIVPAGAGLLAGTEHLIPRENSPGNQHVYYIQNGDPTRAIRPEPPKEVEPPEVLVEANAIAQAMTPDADTLLYVSDGVLYAIGAAGGEPRALVEDAESSPRIELAYSSTPAAASRQASSINEMEVFRKKPELVYTANGKLHRVSLAGDVVDTISGGEARAGTAVYDGLGEAILFLTSDGALARVAPKESEAETIAGSVDRFWTIPGRADVLVATEGTLSLVSPESE
jgi:hypothetical protein